MNLKVSIKKKNVIPILAIITALCISVLMHVGDIRDGQFILATMTWIVVISVIIAKSLLELKCSQNIRIIIVAGLLIRFVMLIFATNDFGAITALLHSMGDESQFLEGTNSFLNGDFSMKYLRYPFVTALIYHLVGAYPIAIRLSNIVFWYLGILIIARTVNRLEGRGNEFLIGLYSLLPFNLIISVLIMRESLMSLSLMISFYFFWRWMETGNRWSLMISLVSAIPAIFLHNGNLAIYGCIFFTILFWDVRKHKWKKFTWKTAVFIAAIIFIVPIYQMIVRLFPGYLPKTLSLDTIAGYTFIKGRTDYVTTSMIATNIPEFIYYSIYRMIYFWISPTPRFWGSVKDVLGFVADTLVWMVFFYKYITGIVKKRLKEESKVGIVFLLIYTFIYGWGTQNGGTAMRHRDMISGVMILTALIGTKERRKLSSVRRTI